MTACCTEWETDAATGAGGLTTWAVGAGDRWGDPVRFCRAGTCCAVVNFCCCDGGGTCSTTFIPINELGPYDWASTVNKSISTAEKHKSNME